MARVTDVRGKPGDIVMVRGASFVKVFQHPSNDTGQVAQHVSRRALGLIVSVHATAWTYVLWSDPSVLGWVADGFLRTVKMK